MAIVPMKQQLNVLRSTGETDIYGRPTGTTELTLKCRITEGSFVTTDKESSETGRTVVATAQIMLDKLTDIRYDDKLTYTDELGRITTGYPKNIAVKRGIGGKPMLTEVLL